MGKNQKISREFTRMNAKEEQEFAADLRRCTLIKAKAKAKLSREFTRMNAIRKTGLE
jgi:hypothetical protein